MGSLIGPLTGSLMGSPIRSLIGSLIGSLIRSLIGSPIGSLIGSLMGSLIGSLIPSLKGSLIGSLMASLIGSLMGSLIASLIRSVTKSAFFFLYHFLSVYFFSIAPSDGQCRTTSQKISRPGLMAFGRLSPKFEHLPWLALIVPPTLFHRRRRHFSSLPTSSPFSQFRRERAYFHATMFPSPYTLLGWSNASQTQNSMDIDDSKHPTLPKNKKLHPRSPSGSPLIFGQYSHIDRAAPTALQ